MGTICIIWQIIIHIHTNNSYNSYTYRLWVRYVSFSKLFFIYIKIIHTIHIHTDYGYDMYHLANYYSYTYK